ncbi:hypothetical protein [Sphingopyxis granuli]|uniref:hypothetical protein n=1 Tax=Sphingopyxis granuli TaxID=267128 RepID=UPI00301C1B79
MREPPDDERWSVRKALDYFSWPRIGSRGHSGCSFGPAELFGEPAWDLFLDLFIHPMEGIRITASTLGIASGVPMSTAHRMLVKLCDAGLGAAIGRRVRPRLQFIELSPIFISKRWPISRRRVRRIGSAAASRRRCCAA